MYYTVYSHTIDSSGWLGHDRVVILIGRLLWHWQVRQYTSVR